MSLNITDREIISEGMVRASSNLNYLSTFDSARTARYF